MSAVIEMEKLTRRYGRRRGLVDLIRPTSGRALLSGRDPRRHAVPLHRRIGYLAGDFVANPRQRAGECLTFLADLRGGIPKAHVAELAGRLERDLTARIKTMSKGNRQQVGLVQAFMHRPDLLILDEPTSGLDPVAQQTFIDLVREARAARQTVCMSSHIMSEVQAVADRVGIIRDGHLVALDTVARLRYRNMHEFQVTFAGPIGRAALSALPKVSDLTIDGPTARFRLAGSPAKPLPRCTAGPKTRWRSLLISTGPGTPSTT